MQCCVIEMLLMCLCIAQTALTCLPSIENANTAVHCSQVFVLARMEAVGIGIDLHNLLVQRLPLRIWVVKLEERAIKVLLLFMHPNRHTALRDFAVRCFATVICDVLCSMQVRSSH